MYTVTRKIFFFFFPDFPAAQETLFANVMIKKPAFPHTYKHTHTGHMALFGVLGHFSVVEWTAWQLVTDEHSYT